MLNITKISKYYNKSAGRFTAIAAHRPLCVTSKGRYTSHTLIPDDLIPDFLLWLSPEIKLMTVTVGWEKTLKHVLKEIQTEY